jgi:hypothetical protein
LSALARRSSFLAKRRRLVCGGVNLNPWGQVDQHEIYQIEKGGRPGEVPYTGGDALLTDVRQMILQASESVVRAVDSGLTLLYWNVYVRIRKDVLKEKRAEYGAEIVAALLRQLTLRVP